MAKLGNTARRAESLTDLLGLKFALVVGDCGSFRKAATILDVEPSAVSRRVRALEDAIGVGLFQRQKQGVSRTPAGRRILARARIIMDELDLMVRTEQLNGSGTEGSLCIGVVSSIAGGVLRHLLSSFSSVHPKIDLMVVEGSPRDHIPAVSSLRMDATFVVGMPLAPGCEVEPLWRERIMVALPSRHPLASIGGQLAWKDLADERFIVSKMDPGPEIQDFVVKHLATLGRHPEVQPRPVNRETLLALIGLGLGISLVGEAEAAVIYPYVMFMPLEDEYLPFHVVWSIRNDNPALRRFLSQSRIEAKRFGADLSVADVEASAAIDPSQ